MERLVRVGESSDGVEGVVGNDTYKWCAMNTLAVGA